MPTPHIAMAEPCLSRGKVSKSVACDIGTSAAPRAPCSTRKITSWSREVAMPHSAEATVKPATETRSTRLRPKRPASLPVGGVMTAAAIR